MSTKPYTVRTFDNIDPAGLALFPTNWNVGPDVQSPDAILLRGHKLSIDDIPPSVRLIVRAGAGFDTIAHDALERTGTEGVTWCAERGIIVENTADSNSLSVALLVFTLMLAASRRLVEGFKYSSSHLRDPESNPLEAWKKKKQNQGYEITGKTLGIVGYGNIGQHVAQIAQGFRMEVAAHETNPQTVSRYGDTMRFVTLERLMQMCDIVTFHIPANPSTKGMVNAHLLAGAKRGMLLINTARAEIIEAGDVLAALDSGVLSGYCSDFPLARRDDCFQTPHIGATTKEAELRSSTYAVEQIMAFCRDAAVLSAVNAPVVSMNRVPAHTTRFAVLHQNQPGVAFEILKTIRNAGMNISRMELGTKNLLGYLIVDVDAVKTYEGRLSIIELIRELPIVKWVRVLN